MNRTVRREIHRLIRYEHTRRYRRGYDWNGYEVYVPVYSKRICIGLPSVILVKGDEARWSTVIEGINYVSYRTALDREKQKASVQG